MSIDDSKLFIVGANGQLGTALRKKYPQAKYADVVELDITNQACLESYDWSNISMLLNAAAYTNVDGAESNEGRIAAWSVNATAVGYLSQVAIKNDMTFVHVSTDYVFDGTKSPHVETEAFSPISVYGASKAAGDIAVGLIPKHYILRTSWVIGEGKNFVRTMLGLAQKGVSPAVVADQIGRLTFTSELVRAIDHLLNNNAPHGTYNVSNSGETVSWAEITRNIFKLSKHSDLTVKDISTKEYYADKEGIAPRPLQSTLALEKIQSTGFTSHDWREELKLYLQESNQAS